MSFGIRKNAESGAGRLDSWKEIASHLNRDVRTVQRWEHSKGLPVHRLGEGKRAPIYALESELDRWAGGAAESLHEDPAPSRSGIVLAAALVATGFVGILAGWWFTRPVSLPARVKPFTTYTGIEWSPSFSPDGKRVAFLWDGGVEGASDIYVKLEGAEGAPLRLTTGADPHALAWSPDGRWIGFLRSAPGGCDMYVVPSLGGGAQKRVGGPVFCLWLSWTPEGNWAVVASKSPDGRPAVALLPVEGGERRIATSPPAEAIGDVGGVVSPDGRNLAFLRQIADNVRDIYCQRLSQGYQPEGEPRRLTNENSQVGNILWAPDSRELVFGAGRSGVRELWRVPVNGSRSAAPVRTAVKIGAGDLALSRQGDKLVYPDVSLDADLWRLELAGHPNQPPVRFISSTRMDSSPRFSPNGKRIAFASNRSGQYQIWVCDSDGGNLMPLTSLSSPLTGMPRWSPDGSQIALDARVEGTSDIWVVAAAGGKPRRLTTHAAHDVDPAWSHDGKWIYFGSDRSGQYQIWKIPAEAAGSPAGEGNRAVQVTKNGGRLALESPDGKFLYYAQGFAKTAIWRVPAEGGEEVQVVDSLNYCHNFDVFEDGIYYQPGGPPRELSIRFFKFSTRASALIGTVEKQSLHGMAVSPDRRWLLFTTIERHGGDLWMIENFR